MVISTKKKAVVRDYFKLIQNSTFDEKTIKALCIELREGMDKKSTLREFSDSLAHSERNKGVIHDTYNSRFAKISFIDERLELLGKEFHSGLFNVETDRQISDWIFKDYPFDAIPKIDYELLIKQSIIDIPDSAFKKHAFISKGEIETIIKNGYKYDAEKKHYKLAVTSLSEINRTIDYTKFLMGTIAGKTVYHENLLIKSIVHEFSKSIKLFGLDITFIDTVKKNMNDIVICIMSLLHDTQLDYYNKRTGRMFLSIYPPTENQTIGSLASSNSRICLIVDAKIHFPVLISNNRIGSYLDEVDVRCLQGMTHYDEIPWCFTKRNSGGKLVLSK